MTYMPNSLTKCRRIDETNQRCAGDAYGFATRIDVTNQRIDAVHSDLIGRIDTTNDRLNRLYGSSAAREYDAWLSA